MVENSVEYSGISMEDMGALNQGFLRFSNSGFLFKNISTGKVLSVNIDDIAEIYWQRLANKPGLKIVTKKGIFHRLCGFKETDFNKISQYCTNKWNKKITKKELSLKGWNYGDGKIEGQNLVFEIDNKLAFEIPLTNVSNCVGNKSEVSLEFHVNDECPVQLIEMRFHVPQDPEKMDEVDEVEEFRKAIMQFAEIEGETGQPIANLPQALCTTPRGRYDIKVFHNLLFFHGKTYDYKITFKQITRMFLLPHKDGRHMFFVLHINPPIRQGQTRYPFLVLEFSKDEMLELDLVLTDEQLAVQYESKLERHMEGLYYEVIAKLFRVLIKSKIIIPGKFEGASGTPAISCALRQASGYLYPLEKGFVYVHKPPMYIRFEEIDNVHFARSDVSTRSFDFEIVQKTGVSILFSSVGKEEYNKLFDFVQSKGLRIRNASRLPEKPNYKEDKFADSDEELDPYKEGLKQDVRDRATVNNDSDSDSEDEDFDVKKAVRQQKKDKDSSEGSGSEPEEEFDDSDDSVSDDMMKKTSKKNTVEKSKKERVKSSEAGVSNENKSSKHEKKKKDPNAPKRNQTPYFIWLNENRHKIKKEGDSLADTATRAGQMWKELTEEEKKPYEKKAKEDKERYDREIREYNLNKPETNTTKHQKSLKRDVSQTLKSKNSISPSKKAISKEFVDDSDSSNSKPSSKKPKKQNDAKTSMKKKEQVKDEDDDEAISEDSLDQTDSGESSDLLVDSN